jgi:perosamine synthetase
VIPIARTDIGDAEKQAVIRVMESGRIALGEEMQAFEREFAAYLGVADAIMVNSGTSGLMISLFALGIQPGDEVIIPALTFVGTANAVLACGATPVLVDVLSGTANIDPEKIVAAITRKTRAIIPVHLFGLPADMNRILDIASVHKLAVVEDACEAVGAEYGGNKAGAMGDVGVFGFYPNKVLTTGEGGMITVNDPEITGRCRALINQGRSEDYEARDLTGYSLRGSELGAAIGRVQLASLDRRLIARRDLALEYRRALKQVPAIACPWPECAERCWFTMPVLLPRGSNRDGVMAHLNSQGIATADYFPVIHSWPNLTARVVRSGDLRCSDDLSGRLLCLPFWEGVEEHIEFIVRELGSALEA